jgi:hypothetical protein
LQARALPLEIKRRGTNPETENDALLRGLQDPFVGECECGTDGRMAGERHFAIQSKDPHLDVSTGSIGGKNERALGEIHLTGNASHVVRRQPRRIDEDRELVTAQRIIGEDIVVKIPVGASRGLRAEPSE